MSKLSSASEHTFDPVYFPKPSVIIYRFLNVIKLKNQLVYEFISFLEANLYQFLRNYWNEPDMIDLIQALRNESMVNSMENSDNEPPTVFAETQPMSAILDSVIIYVLWKCYKANSVLDVGHQTVALKRLIHWLIVDGIITVRIIYGDNRIISFTDHGDLTKFFEEYFDNIPSYSIRNKDTYTDLAKKFGLPPSSILLVAFSKTECKKAARAGYMVAKIREYNQPIPKYYTIRIISNISDIRFAQPVTCSLIVNSDQSKAKFKKSTNFKCTNSKRHSKLSKKESCKKVKKIK